MKELTIEEKAKTYDEVRKKIAIRFGSNVADEIFSQFEESEDERIRKALIEMFNVDGQRHGIQYKEILAWFEKQGEQKPSDKVEPKFHEGEWVVQGYNILKIKLVGDTRYCFETVGGYVDDVLVSKIDSQFHLWTIQDAKDGDVLVNDAGCIFIYKNYMNDIVLRDYCHLSTFGYIVTENDNEGGYTHITNVYPATKEQRDLLFSKMKEAGYEWNAEKKELKKIEQNTAWSEEDEKMLGYAIKAVHYMYVGKDRSSTSELYCKVANWLKLLKDRCLPQPMQEQGKKDKELRLDCIKNLEQQDPSPTSIYAEWLKPLHPRNHWKSSEEQIKALEFVLNDLDRMCVFVYG